MPEILIEIISIFAGAFAIAIVFAFSVFKLILPKLIDTYIKRIEYEHNRALTILEAGLNSQFEKLKTAVEIAHRSQEEIKIKRIDSIQKLWIEIVRLQREFSPLIAVETILSEQELTQLFQKKGDKSESMQVVVDEFGSFKKVAQKLDNSNVDNVVLWLVVGTGSAPRTQAHSRIFVTDELWNIYDAFICIYGRLGVLLNNATTQRTEVNWRSDELMQSTIVKVFSKDVPSLIQDQKISLQVLISLLERKFLVEAQRAVQGADLFSDTAHEIHQIIDSVISDENSRRIYSNFGML